MKLMKGKCWFALILVIALIAGYLPMTQVRAAECPVFNGSTDTNVAENATVYKYLNRTSTKAYADYATNGNKVVLAAQESGYFGNIKYGASNSYNYSAKIALGSGSSLSAINFVVAKMSHTDGIDRFIVVDVRVNGGGNWVHVAQTHDLTGGAIADGNFIRDFGQLDSSKVDKEDIDYTVQYKNGVISFWFEGTQLGSSIDLNGDVLKKAGLSNPVPFAGFDSTDYSGTVSDVKIWGDVTNEVVPMPVFDESTDTNAAKYASVYKYTSRTGTQEYADYAINGNKVVLASTQGGYFGNIKYGTGNSYNYSAKIALGSGSSLSAINFVVAKMSHTDGIDRFITVDVRVNGGGNWVHIASTYDCSGTGAGELIQDFGTIKPSLIDKGDLDYTVQYKNGVITFWFEGTQLGSSIDLNGDTFKKAGLSNPVPFAGFDSTNYSGTISNVKIWGDVTNAVTPSYDSNISMLKGYTLSLFDGEIGLNYYMDINPELSDTSNITMHYTLDGTEQVVAATAKNGYQVFTCRVPAKNMTDEIPVTIYNGETQGATYTYSIKRYAETILKNTEYAKEHPLVEAMLNYGSYAQNYFNYNTDKLANGGTYLGDQALADVTASTFQDYATQSQLGNDDVKLHAASLILKAKTSLRLYLQLKDAVDVSTATVSGAEALKQKGAYYCADVSGILPQDLFETYTVVIGYGDSQSATVSYNCMTYAYNVLNSDSTPNELKDLMRAIYLYGQAAKEYVGQ